jgi:hypothetical protein
MTLAFLLNEPCKRMVQSAQSVDGHTPSAGGWVACDRSIWTHCRRRSRTADQGLGWMWRTCVWWTSTWGAFSDSVRQQVSVSSSVRGTSTTGLTQSGAAKRERRGAYHHHRAVGVVTGIRQGKSRTQRGTPGGHPPCTAPCATRADPVGACADHPACLYACHGAMHGMHTRVPVWSTSCRRSVVLSMTRPDIQD